MTTDLDALPDGVDGKRMAGTVAALASAPFAGRRADTPERVEATTLVAVCRLVLATAWLAATTPATLPSLIGD